MSTDLSARYGTRRRWGRPVWVAVAAVLAVTFVGWLAWAAWFHSTPEVESDLISFEVVDRHESTAVVQVQLADGVTANCRARALAEDHTTVGELNFSPVDGRNEVSIRTERGANAVEMVGCTTADQQRPR